jgi:hypothetical protein
MMRRWFLVAALIFGVSPVTFAFETYAWGVGSGAYVSDACGMAQYNAYQSVYNCTPGSGEVAYLFQVSDPDTGSYIWECGYQLTLYCPD